MNPRRDSRARRPQQPAPDTVAALITACARRLAAAGLWFGHGTDNARDEAAALVFHVLGLDHNEAIAAYPLPVTAAGREAVEALLVARIATRKPLPYLTGEAWFAGLRFAVDERVLIPRSPFAELIRARFAPWVEPAAVRHILEVGTGSGCIAVALAVAFPASRIVATDISGPALDVAAINVARHGLDDRIRLVCTDLFAGVAGPFDLLVSNPPYVPARELGEFPPEYGHEPELALASGPDGMETPARILHHASRVLDPGGWLAMEVGAGAPLLEARFPMVPFIWPGFEAGGDGIALVPAADLPAAPPVSR